MQEKKTTTIQIKGDVSTSEVHSIVGAVSSVPTVDDIEVNILSHLPYDIDLIFEGELLDFTRIHALSIDDAMSMALDQFKSSQDYDLIPSANITLDMLWLNEE